MRIGSLTGREILDSRGYPTISVRCELSDGSIGVASVPSGASRGIGEAVEVRDGDAMRYAGLGCRRAASNVSDQLATTLMGIEIDGQAHLDELCNLADGTSDKSHLGANAILGTSLAFAKAAAVHHGLVLYEYFALLAGTQPRMPRLQVNLFSGGVHAGRQVAIQDVMVAPLASNIDSALVATFDVYRAAVQLIEERYSMWRLTADEGGLAPPAPNAQALISDAVDAIDRCEVGNRGDVALGIDVAASQFYWRGGYHIDDQVLTDDEMIRLIGSWVDAYPISTVEDGLADTRLECWPGLVTALGDAATVVGDDLLCTNADRVKRAAQMGACNSLLLKLNQVGSVSEGLQALTTARAAGWQVIISARSGETEDAWLADLAVGWSADMIKVGSITQSERLAKYNRLLEIDMSLV